MHIDYTWKFPSRDNGETEGFSNAALAEFKGNPIQALAREVCQNSLDAADGSGKPVIVEFDMQKMKIDSFPGMRSMKFVISECNNFWKDEGDRNTKEFLRKAARCLKKDEFYVLRVSDYNTKGVKGAYSNKNITPWGSLVKGNSFSVKEDEQNAAGSFGIGKAAPFVSSLFQTVFYRTYDEEEQRAVLGVSRLMAHKIPESECKVGEDPVRRAVGYFGEDDNRKPVEYLPQLDAINERKKHGTDLFIPGFPREEYEGKWIIEILNEVVENFLYSVFAGKLVIKISKYVLSAETLPEILFNVCDKAKDAKIFYEALRENNDNVIEEEYKNFNNLGNLKLRLFYEADLNKKILVVRNSGMKIAKISGLPRGISYTGFLELEGSKLNEFFREMENPKHNAWEPKRHSDYRKALRLKSELETWVKETINAKLVEISGEESDIDVGDLFNLHEKDEDNNVPARQEAIVDTVKTVEVHTEVPKKKRLLVEDLGKGNDGEGTNKEPGTIDDKGDRKGHRRRTGKRKGGQPTGRSGKADPSGMDTLYSGSRLVEVNARIIGSGNGKNKLIFTAKEDISTGKIEIVTKGENGKELSLNVINATGDSVFAEGGHLVIADIKAGERNVAEFTISGFRNYAMGVRAYGNKE